MPRDNLLNKWKSFKKIIASHNSAPTQVKLVFTGFGNALYTVFQGFKRSVLPQLHGPITRMFLFLPHPLIKRVCTALANSVSHIPFCCKISLAIYNHSEVLHPSTQSWCFTANLQYFHRCSLTSLKVSHAKGFFYVPTNSSCLIYCFVPAIDHEFCKICFSLKFSAIWL